MNELNNKIRDILGENTTHYERTCRFCGFTWLGLHCPHDGYQNECGNCNRKPPVIDYYDCACNGVTDLEEATDALTTLITEQVRLGIEEREEQLKTDIVNGHAFTCGGNIFVADKVAMQEPDVAQIKDTTLLEEEK